MSNLEVLDRATSFTTGAYMKAYYKEVEKGIVSYNDLEKVAIYYSASSLMKVMYSNDGICNNYTRKDNLRYDVSAIGTDGIKNELLKNVVNVTIFHKMNDTEEGKCKLKSCNKDFSDDKNAVIIFNNMVTYGLDKAYTMLSDSDILYSMCRLFSNYRREGKKEILDNIASTNNVAMYLNNELDSYYAKYGKNPKLNKK